MICCRAEYGFNSKIVTGLGCPFVTAAGAPWIILPVMMPARSAGSSKRAAAAGAAAAVQRWQVTLPDGAVTSRYFFINKMQLRTGGPSLGCRV